MIPTALSIAGSDPSGGAGLQADLKSFAANGVYGMAVVTALTAQNTTGVSAIHAPPADFVAEQIRMVFDDIRVDAVKIGMIANAAIAEAVAGALTDAPGDAPGDARGRRIVLDPVMFAKGGAALLEPEAMQSLKAHLLPLAEIITPNLPEAAGLLGEEEAASRDAMQAQAEKLLGLGARAVCLKGGHVGGDSSPDLLMTTDGGAEWLEAPRIATKNTHGTGCSLASAIAAGRAKGLAPGEAVRAAKRFIGDAIAAADDLGIGHGHGPVNHFAGIELRT